MNILVIDNGTKHLPDIIKRIDKHNNTITNPENIPKTKYDAIILTGGSKYSVKNHKAYYQKEKELIQTTTTPILGICLGFELICQTFNEKLEQAKEKQKGFQNIRIQQKNWITNTLNKKTLVYEAHRWIVQKTTFLKTLATSRKGVEIVKHPNKEIYGVQFHPELSKTRIIKQFLEQIKVKKK